MKRHSRPVGGFTTVNNSSTNLNGKLKIALKVLCRRDGKSKWIFTTDTSETRKLIKVSIFIIKNQNKESRITSFIVYFSLEKKENFQEAQSE